MVGVLGRMEQDSERFHHTTQKDVQLKTYEIVCFWNFTFIILTEVDYG